MFDKVTPGLHISQCLVGVLFQVSIVLDKYMGNVILSGEFAFGGITDLDLFPIGGFEALHVLGQSHTQRSSFEPLGVWVFVSLAAGQD